MSSIPGNKPENLIGKIFYSINEFLFELRGRRFKPNQIIVFAGSCHPREYQEHDTANFDPEFITCHDAELEARGISGESQLIPRLPDNRHPREWNPKSFRCGYSYRQAVNLYYKEKREKKIAVIKKYLLLFLDRASGGFLVTNSVLVCRKYQ